jgi:SPP1 family predicted phage head-tail adaptor
MNRLVGLYVPTSTSDNEGGFTTTFALQETVWGDFRPQAQNRSLLESELSFTRFGRLFIRFGVTITDGYQLEVEGEMYTIHSIKNVDDARRYYEIEIYF